MPQKNQGQLADLSVEIFKKSGELTSSLPSKVTRKEVAKLVRNMNSYYSNLIEGHKTLPRDIERALRDDFSQQEEDRRNQMLSVAHVKTEEAIRESLESNADIDVYSIDFVTWIHEEFYKNLPEEERKTRSKSGKEYDLLPGKIRDYNVEVGMHTPPAHEAVKVFLNRFNVFYSKNTILETSRLKAIAAAHHRLAWIHPFGDGNGRVARLHSQAALIKAGVDTEGLWTLSRGVARSKKNYYKFLQDADAKRRGALDGRGNLSDEALSNFCIYFLESILDQMNFMIDLISPLKLQERITKYFHFERLDLDDKLKQHYIRLLEALTIRGEVKRGEIADILCLGASAAREVTRKAIEDDLIGTSSEKGPVRINFPTKVVETYFPRLFADLE